MTLNSHPEPECVVCSVCVRMRNCAQEPSQVIAINLTERSMVYRHLQSLDSEHFAARRRLICCPVYHFIVFVHVVSIEWKKKHQVDLKFRFVFVYSPIYMSFVDFATL